MWRTWLALAALAVPALPSAASQVLPCQANVEVDAAPLPGGRLVPESGVFAANVTFRYPLTGPGTCSPDPEPCPAAYIPPAFGLGKRPAYATFSFSPWQAQPALEGVDGWVARSSLQIRTNESAPPDKEEDYEARVYQCGSLNVTKAFKIRNAPSIGASHSVGQANATIEPVPEAANATLSAEFHGSATVPGFGWGLAVAAAILARRRR